MAAMLNRSPPTCACCVTSVKRPLPSFRYRWLVGGNGGHAEQVAPHGRLARHVGEAPLAVVPVQVVGRRSLRRLAQRIRMYAGAERLSADREEVQQAVVVVVEPHGAP